MPKKSSGHIYPITIRVTKSTLLWLESIALSKGLKRAPSTTKLLEELQAQDEQTQDEQNPVHSQ